MRVMDGLIQHIFKCFPESITTINNKPLPSSTTLTTARLFSSLFLKTTKLNDGCLYLTLGGQPLCGIG